MQLQQQLKASHEPVKSDIIALMDQCTNTESDEENSREKLGLNFIAASPRRNQNLKLNVNFFWKRDRE